MLEAGDYCGFAIAIEPPGIVVITFNEPERLNGMTQPMKRDLVETLTQCQMEDQVRIVVFTGSGRAFSAGDDISGKPRTAASTLVPPIHRGHDHHIGTYEGLRVLSQPVNSAIRNLDKITIAAMNGVAIQTGFSLALACDFRIAARSARMGSATLRFALLPDEGGQYLLVQHLGLSRTLDFLMRKRIVEAEEALELGLVNEVVDDEGLMERALELARE
ncbi:MAG: enoyl-CoA hydratase/isomerase family protein, partial [Thermoanaerobaculia bacterium]|nr:enoyl-CoA hydratase/isomerase family protein [Thermoanaerobaculia bacterium]